MTVRDGFIADLETARSAAEAIDAFERHVRSTADLTEDEEGAEFLNQNLDLLDHLRSNLKSGDVDVLVRHLLLGAYVLGNMNALTLRSKVQDIRRRLKSLKAKLLRFLLVEMIMDDTECSRSTARERVAKHLNIHSKTVERSDSQIRNRILRCPADDDLKFVQQLALQIAEERGDIPLEIVPKIFEKLRGQL